MKVAAIKGFSDILPGEIESWQFVEDKAREVFALYNFSEIRIPILEKTELFSRSLGETTDIVEKEMYTFVDRDAMGAMLPPGPDAIRGSSLTLRPEATAGVVRAYIEAELYKIEPVRKLFCIGPMFRRERPQKGRLRQFYQIDAEVLGRGDPFADAELLLLLRDLFEMVGLDGLTLELNSLGCVACRPRYREDLLSFLGEREKKLCGNCQRRMGRNPMRVLDCKEEVCSQLTGEAPSILGFLCKTCEDHFGTVKQLLGETGLGFKLNPRMVRGLDYYCRTAFEWTSSRLGSQNAVAAGRGAGRARHARCRFRHGDGKDCASAGDEGEQESRSSRRLSGMGGSAGARVGVFCYPQIAPGGIQCRDRRRNKEPQESDEAGGQAAGEIGLDRG